MRKSLYFHWLGAQRYPCRGVRYYSLFYRGVGSSARGVHLSPSWHRTLRSTELISRELHVLCCVFQGPFTLYVKFIVADRQLFVLNSWAATLALTVPREVD